MNEKIIKNIVDFIEYRVDQASKSGVVIGISGGLDSAVVLSLAIKALGKERVTAISMPDAYATSDDDLTDIENLAKVFDITIKQIDIISIKNEFRTAIRTRETETSEFALGNTAARIRMSLLYYYAFVNNLLVIGTSDKSEYEIGYFTKHGDGAADFQPILGLYKTEVRDLAKLLKLPERIYTKPSSPNLLKDQTAEGDLGVSYEEVDAILLAINKLQQIENLDVNEDNAMSLMEYVVMTTRIEMEKVRNVLNLILSTNHKRRKAISLYRTVLF